MPARLAAISGKLKGAIFQIDDSPPLLAVKRQPVSAWPTLLFHAGIPASKADGGTVFLDEIAGCRRLSR
ncbi:MAG: hypothetical protein ABR555_01300 [Pyrinomonadaceae bacterium]